MVPTLAALLTGAVCISVAGRDGAPKVVVYGSTPGGIMAAIEAARTLQRQVVADSSFTKLIGLLIIIM